MAYTFSAMRIELLRRLGGRTDSVSAVRAGEFLNSAQLKLAEADLQIPFFEEVATVLFTSGQPEISLLQATPSFPLDDIVQVESIPNPPAIVTSYTTDQHTSINNLSDLIGIRLVQRMPQEALTNDTGWRMQRMSWAEWREIERTQASGQPTRWARLGHRLAVDPKPDALYELKIDYRRRPQLDLIEVEGEWQETLLTIGESIGQRAFGQPDLALAALNMLPRRVRLAIENPLDYAEWDALWDDELSLQPRMAMR